ncbi:hypothetical protein AN958_01922 [Leucoagaricus sp. SymC.cos]|nr:hypothetical protein AN958_01922 [Leucoagaricus sp. SymC.cos]
MHGDPQLKERVRAVNSWRNGEAWRDVVFLEGSSEAQTISDGLTIARTRLSFSFKFKDHLHECALIEDFEYVRSTPNEDSGMWIVKPKLRGRYRRSCIIPITHIYRGAHLLPIHGVDNQKVPPTVSYANQLDFYSQFYVSKPYNPHESLGA